MALKLSNTEEQALEQAARWFVHLQEAQQNPDTKQPCQQSFKQWLTIEENQLAWQQINQIQQQYQQHQNQLTHQSLSNAESASLVYNNINMPRRTALKSLAGFSVSAWLGWQGYNSPSVRNRLVGLSADISSSVGQSKALTLADNTQLSLNTNSAINTINTSEVELLKGEVYLNNFALLNNNAASTKQKTTRLLAKVNGKLLTLTTQTNQQTAGNSRGTRCSVLLSEDQSQCTLSLYQGSASVSYQGKSRQLITGQQVHLTPNKVGKITLANSTAMPLTTEVKPPWLNGELHANDISLAAFISQLKRYRSGYIRLSPELDNLRIAGVYPAYDSDAALRLLANALPIDINYITHWFVSITPSQVTA